MKISHLTYSYKPVIGGQEAYVADLFDLLATAGHEQHVYQRANECSDPEIVHLSRLFAWLPGMLSFDLALLLHRHRLRHEDILIVNYPEVYPAVAWHKKAIVISHGATWTREGARSNDLRKRQAELAWRMAPGFVVNDSFVLRAMGLDIEPRSRMFEEVAERRWFIPNCVNIERLSGKNYKRPWDFDEPVILVPRNLTRSRGIDLAISALPFIKTAGMKMKMVIVGDIIAGVVESVEYQRSVIDLVKSLGLDEDVIFAGRIERGQMPAFYQHAMLTLIPTRASEGTSLAALESMACHTPVVATNVEGLLDIPARHVDPTPEAIAQGCLVVLKDRDRFADAQKEAVALVYNLNNWQRSWLSVIDRISRR